MTTTDIIKLTGIQTGSLPLNQILRDGGLPRGKMIEVSGEESTGKTTLALSCIEACQKEGGIAALLDSDCSLNSSYAKKVGVNIDDLIFSQPKTAEMAFDVIFTLINKAAVNLVVVDSLASLLPQGQLTSSMSDNSALKYHQTLAEGFCKLRSVLAFKGAQCTVIFTNQLRMSNDAEGNFEKASGVKHLANNFMDTRIFMSIGKPITNAGGEAQGYHCCMRVTQADNEESQCMVTTPVIYGKGFASSYETLQIGLKKNVVIKTREGFYALGRHIGQTGGIAKDNLDKNFNLRLVINKAILTA